MKLKGTDSLLRPKFEKFSQILTTPDFTPSDQSLSTGWADLARVRPRDYAIFVVVEVYLPASQHVQPPRASTPPTAPAACISTTTAACISPTACAKTPPLQNPPPQNFTTPRTSSPPPSTSSKTYTSCEALARYKGGNGEGLLAYLATRHTNNYIGCVESLQEPLCRGYM
ncbi:hypothetical protein GWK47_003745 [Chionoecetes opilio]|uniref:Uncharacterized protein n=1 Tax=Chionoecetes opilio TaxID=41210 RepID=A0A8J5D3U3_CHIOP|nr:hypothetical protein GWK47_003745 [Chionoecetes opilio]